MTNSRLPRRTTTTGLVRTAHDLYNLLLYHIHVYIYIILYTVYVFYSCVCVRNFFPIFRALYITCVLHCYTCHNHPSVEDYITFKRHRRLSIVRPGRPRSCVYFIFRFFFFLLFHFTIHLFSIGIPTVKRTRFSGPTPPSRGQGVARKPRPSRTGRIFHSAGGAWASVRPPARFVTELLELRPAGRTGRRRARFTYAFCTM